MLRNKRITKSIAVFFILTMLVDIIYPTAAYALTGGPSQPEVQSFEPIGTSEMVDVFSGDFTYNIPLMDVGGYPINISYHAGIGMDQEASWVGLGWNINPGAITRNMRSLPDDFSRDMVKKEFNIKDNHTYGAKFAPNLEAFGIDALKNLNLSLGLSYNNYRGVGFDVGINPSITASLGNMPPANVGLGISASSSDGVGINPNLSFQAEIDKKDKYQQIGASIGLGFNSREGLKQLTVSTSREVMKFDKKGNLQVLKNNGGSSISFANPTYVPQVNLPMVNANFSFGGKVGGSLFGVDVSGYFSGYYSGQYLSTREKNFPAYGYLYAHNGRSQEAMLDFNREKDGSFTQNTPNLPLTNFSYDIYSVAGQGIGGMYRPFRSDVGVLYDPRESNTGGGFGVDDLEFGSGNIFKAGVNISVNFSQSSSGKWSSRNELDDILRFREESGDPAYESVYFKQAGEKTAETDPEHFEKIGGFDPVRVGINGYLSASLKRLEKDRGSAISLGSEGIVREERQRRNQAISFLTAEEAHRFGLEKTIRSYNDFDLTQQGRYVPAENISRLSYPKHHISEITALRPDGARYVYGIPAYNNTQVESTFAVNAGGDCFSGLVPYTSTDDSKNNSRGLDHYFNRVTMPKYAHSYLLTAIISPDYVDLTGNGPSDDDLGSYTKINYKRAVPEYKWRTPYTDANFSEGLKSNSGANGDNKASYVYGTKDIWYVHSIESRTHVAEFILQDRADGYAVQGQSGGRSSGQTMKKLVRIDLYAKPERKNNPSASPIKSVHFEYDYSLFSAGQGVPNNNKQSVDAGGFPNQGGKLTLKKLFFTYEGSQKGRLSPYEFHYADLDHDEVMDVNYAYNLKGYDRWGNFKPNPANASCDESGPLSSAEFPYVEQDRATADLYAAAWSLTSVDLPSGGTIRVDYEADDYAYVQDRPAMQMFKVTGSGPDSAANPVSGNQLMTPSNANHNYLFFELNEPISAEAADPRALIARKYIKGLQEMYFRFLMNITGSKYEYVPGYVEIEDYGVASAVQGGYYTHGFVKLKKVNVSDKSLIPGEDVNPISRTAWQFARLYMPVDAYNQPSINDNGAAQVVKSLVSAFDQIGQFVKGINRDLRDRGFGKQFVRNKSWIRLYNPGSNKLGGGLRVRKVALSDSWNSMTGHDQAEYGQEYDYTIPNEFGEAISSGVASYEPMIGGDENPFRQPVAFSTDRLLAPSDDYYLEEPFGESFFPGASVGYSRVTVRNLQYENVTKNATGSVVHEFYTARDYPTITAQTRLKSIRKRPNLLLSLLKVSSKDFMTASQGYAIELNDMHGKPRAQWVYPENSDDPISGVEYFYKQKTITEEIEADGYTRQVQRRVLDNEIEVIEKDGSITKKQVGVDYDFAVDMRNSESFTTSGTVNTNVDGFVLGIFPIVVPVVLPSISTEKTRFNSAVTTKVINRYGLLDRVVAHDLGSSVATKNLLYDGVTGEVLLTETTNQFSDPVYAFTYPAHWGYDRMGPASKNIGVAYEQVQLSNITNADNYFVLGDELALGNGTESLRGWVASVSSGGIVVLDSAGNPLPDGPYDLKILRSGRRNQQTVSIGTVTSLENPMVDTDHNGSYDLLAFNEVINSGTVEFSEEWETFCNCGRDPSGIYNPYVYGSLGNWRAKRSSLFLTERAQSELNNNVDIRHDGIYEGFEPFWAPPMVAGEDWERNPEKWTFTTEVTIFSPYGFELENKDALGRYSAALYGYNNILPTAVANNARFKETAFDGFEDYDFEECQDDHFSFRNFRSERVQTEAHTGRNSMKVEPGMTVEVEKIIIPCQDEAQ